MSEMIQEIERLEESDGVVFVPEKTPQPKNHFTASMGKVKVIGYKESRGTGDDSYYLVQFDAGHVIRVYNAKNVVFGKPKAPKPVIEKPTQQDMLIVGKSA